MMSSHTTKNVSGLYGVSSIQPMTRLKKTSRSLSYCVLKQKSLHVQACSLDLSSPCEKFEKSVQAFIKRVSHVYLHQPRKAGEGGRQRRQKNKRMLTKMEQKKKHYSVSNFSLFNLQLRIFF